MTIYIDLVIAENICMNYIILYGTAIAYKIKPKKIRILFAASIGAAYAILSYIQALETYSSFLLKIFLSIAMVYIAYSPGNLKSLTKQLLTFYLVSFVFGGTAFAMLYFIRPQDILTREGVYLGMYPIKIVFLGAIIGFVLIKAVFKIIKTKFTKNKLFCKVTIKIKDKETKVNALIDTGNLLREPITGNPVVIVEKNYLDTIIPKTIIDNIDSIIEGRYNDMPDDYLRKFRLVPFSSLGKQNGMLLGLKPDAMEIDTEDEQIQVQNAIVGIYNGNLTKNGLYSALIGIGIFERSNSNEFIEFAEKQH